jgi:hypothetical protein
MHELSTVQVAVQEFPRARLDARQETAAEEKRCQGLANFGEINRHRLVVHGWF